jgi:hypothetical protein
MLLYHLGRLPFFACGWLSRFPVGPLTLYTAVGDSATKNTNHELRGTFTAFGNEAVITNIDVWSWAPLAFRLSHRIKRSRVFETLEVSYVSHENLNRSTKSWCFMLTGPRSAYTKEKYLSVTSNFYLGNVTYVQLYMFCTTVLHTYVQ